MTREALPPLLRGIGSSLMLAGALIGFVVARRDGQAARLRPQSRGEASLSRQGTSAGMVGGQNYESVTDRVVENLWFEMLGFAGAATFSGSFYVEYLARRK